MTPVRWRSTRRGVLVGAALTGVAGLAPACTGGTPSSLVIAAGDEGGIYIAFARLLAERLEDRVDGLRVEVLRTEGTVDNLRRLASRSADLGLGLADGVAGVGGPGAGAGQRPHGDDPLALARVYENYLQLVVRDDSALHSVSDLAGRTVSLGAAGSGAAVTGQVLLRAAGLGTGQGRVRVEHAALAQALTDLEDGAVEAILWSGGIPTPAISALDRGVPLRMLPLGSLVPAMQESFAYTRREVPRVGYGPRRPSSSTIGVPNLLLARHGLDPGLARAVVETLVVDAAALVPSFVRGLQYLAPGTMIQTGSVDLHPGAVEAYRELHP